MSNHRQNYTPEPPLRRRLERAADVVLALALAGMLTLGLVAWFTG